MLKRLNWAGRSDCARVWPKTTSGQMIKSFKIKNFRSCRDVSIDGIGQILAIAGRNGAGKTNILEGIAWLASIATTTPWQFIAFEGKTEGAIVFSAGGADYRYEAAVLAGPPSASVREFRTEIRESLTRFDGTIILSRADEQVHLGNGTTLKIGVRASAIPALVSIMPADMPDKRELDAIHRFLTAIRYYSLDEPGHSVEMSLTKYADYTAWAAQYAAGEYSSVPMRLIHVALTAPELFAEIKEVLGDSGLSVLSDIQFDEFTLGNSQRIPDGKPEDEKYYLLRFIPSSCESSVDYSSLSLGTRRVIRIVTSVILDDASVMLMEQPEDSIHSGLMKKVIGFLRQYSVRTQIIMASHSANVVNKMRPEEIRIVHISKGQTKIRSLTREELVAASRYVHDEGPLSEFIQVAIDDTDDDVWNSG